MEELFMEDEPETPAPARKGSHVPLAARMRPRSLEEYAGQQHILGEGKLLRRAVEADRFTSLIFFGPPGVGKTSLAQLIAQRTASRFVNLSGVESNVADIRKAVEGAEAARRLHARTTTLFVDEIHRFNKSQQDVLLPWIERGTVRFIGATTHNPFFYVNSPLISRSQVFQLEALSADDIVQLLETAVQDDERGLGDENLTVSPEALRHLATMADGDARKALSALELAVLTTPPQADGQKIIDLEVAAESIQKKTVVYDGDGDAHYDTISAFIKSIRGSDPDAALYWLAKMLYAGEDFRFIARRLIISASEDIGLADSNALRVAIDAWQAAEMVGLPEGRIPLAHATVYLATAPKSNSAYAALGAATKEVTEGRTLAVPVHLRSTGYKGAKDLGHGKNYKYAHDFEGNYVPQAYLPEGRRFYTPSSNGQELRIKERLDFWRGQFEAANPPPPADQSS
ncbi:MAG: atpase aaa-type core [Verrucomicrobiales bacterium]|nr:atpase aaa-type core [Verrucomicrobiales bacterium]